MRHTRAGFCALALLAGSSAWPGWAVAEGGIRVQVTAPEATGAFAPLRVSGSIEARQTAGLSPRVDGLVEKVYVDAGSVVRKGEVILELDDALVRIELQRAQADVAQALAALTEANRLVEEATRLISTKHLPQTELGRRESGLALAKAELQAARATEADVSERSRRHRLIAPFDGVILDKQVEAGEWITRGTPAVRLASLARARLDVQVSQERIAQFKLDTPVVIIPDAQPSQRIDARVDTLLPIANAQTRTFLVRVVPQRDADALIAGTSATAEFKLPSEQARTRVPRSALQRQPDGSYSVFAINDQETPLRAHRYKVEVGRDLGEQRELLSGLPDGLKVVTRGGEVLKDGQLVQLDPEG